MTRMIDGVASMKSGLPAFMRGTSTASRLDANRAATCRRGSWDSARCLITGASSGMGKALAEQLVRARARVILTGRSVERLQRIAQSLIAEGADPVRVITIPADLTIDGDRQRLFTQITRHFDALDLVINNAGIGAAGQFETHDSTVLRQVFEINFFALAEVCRESLPLLAHGNWPTLVNIGSIVGRRGLPGRTEYSASKFAVTGFTEACASSGDGLASMFFRSIRASPILPLIRIPSSTRPATR